VSAGRPPVFVRGVGAVTPLGWSWAESAVRLARGESAVRAIEDFDVVGFPSRVAACVPKAGRGNDRRAVLARAAFSEAWAAAGGPLAERARIGVFIGAESGRVSLRTLLELARAAGGGDRFDRARFMTRGRELAPLLAASLLSPAAIASGIAGEVGALGPVETISLACASGSAAIVEAVRAIRAGECDQAIAGGVGADVDPLMLAGFGLLGALSQKGCSRPFDARRDGFVVGEGAAIVVLSRERGDSTIEVAGVARSLDAFHLTAPEPDGLGIERAMRAALADAELARIEYIQAHGTSTALNDAVEGAAIHRVFGAALSDARVSSVKGALGHAIAGAGAIGVLCAIDAITKQHALPTAGLEQPDVDLPHVFTAAVPHKVEAALANACAFGGANSCVIVRQAP
jgi:3-oxoacyl-[acyl-carrier-protein] synthase II